jgi:hypothetical protein
MTRRSGERERLVNVVVSPAMLRLRAEQTTLNFFLWTSELAYGVVHTSGDARLDDREAKALKAFSGVRSEAWFPNTAGRQKYHGTVGDFLDQLKKDVTTVAQATSVLWYSRFEDYLNARVRPFVKTSRWGPFAESLCIPALTRAKYAVRPATVVQADICRLVRNAMVHSSPVPVSMEDPKVEEWIRASTRLLARPGWQCENPRGVATEATKYVIGQIADHLATTAAEGKQLTAPFFYALFAFTNFDSLAFEIEEALQPDGTDGATIRRQERKVRRKSLIKKRRQA